MGDRGYEGDSGYLAHLGTTAGTGRWDLGPREPDRWGAAPAASTGIDRGTDDAAASVARRLQGRLDRHLWLLERLQAEQPYPGSSGLTELQDTARRMRRDTESLLLLSGHEPGVPSSGPRRLADLVADAAAAAEEPRRVEVRHAPGAVVSPSAAAEFVHVLAELIDHVTAVYPDARIELVSHLEPMTGPHAGATVDVLVDGAARHDPDGLGGLRAAAAEQLARCSRHGIALRRPPGGPPPTGSGLVASVHCPPAAVTVDEPPPARPETRVNGNGLPPYDYGIGGGIGGGIWGGNGNGSGNGNGNTGGWNTNGNGTSGGTGGVDTSGSWNSNGNGTSGGVDTSGSWNANGNGSGGGSRGVDTSGSWNANGNGSGGGSRGVDTSGSWNANGNGSGGGTGGVDNSGSWNANGAGGVNSSGSWNANGNGSTGGVNTGDIWGGNGTSSGAGTGGAGGGGLWGSNGSTAPQTGPGTGTGTGGVDSGGLWGGNGTSAGTGSGTGGAGGGGLWGGNGSSAGTGTGSVDSGGLWGGSGTVSSTGSGTVTGGGAGGVNGGANGGANGTDIWGGNGIGGTGVGNARAAAGAGGSTTEHVNGAARPPRSFDEPPAYKPSSSSQVDELFGPLLDLPLEPIDDRYATPIFEAIASAWFREDAAGGAPGRPQDWETPQDDEWRAAAARAARPDPEPTTTASGLPRRSPGDRLVPPPRRSERSGQHASQRRGGQHGGESVSSPPERVPDRVRDRLSTYQRGLREGRHRATDADSDDW